MSVTTRSIAEDSGSTSAETFTWKSPVLMNVYSGTTVRSAPLRTSRKTPIATSADAAMAPAAPGPGQRPRPRRPKRTLTRNAASGNAGMSHTFWITGSTLHVVELVHVDRRAVAVRGQDDRQAARDLGSGDDEHEHDEHAPALIQRVTRGELAGTAGEGDQREIARVEHELDA